MRMTLWLAGLLLSLSAAASETDDFARQWTVLGDCVGAPAPVSAPAQPLACDGAFALGLDESVYRQVTRRDLSDIAAFNADGEALPFGPMPAAYVPPKGNWRDAGWFALPAGNSGEPQDLHLHVTRSVAGDLNLDATLSHGVQSTVQDVLIDVRANDHLIEAIEFELQLDAADFSAQLDIDASDDLQSWRNIVAGATVAQLRQGGQTLVRRHVEFLPQAVNYLRVHVVGPGPGLPLRATRLLLHPLANAADSLRRSAIAAEFVRRDGLAYVYRLPARVPVERVNIALGDDNAIANFSVSVRDPDQKNWSYIGQLNAFRLRGAGVALDNEAMDIGITRLQEWRIEPNIELARTPTLQLAYRPETWLLLTHGRPPYVVAAGSSVARRGSFPLEALVGHIRARYGRLWLPPPASLGPMKTAGGEAALTAYDPERKRTWILWAVLVLGAGVIVAMVLRLLRAPPDPPV